MDRAPILGVSHCHQQLIDRWPDADGQGLLALALEARHMLEAQMHALQHPQVEGARLADEVDAVVPVRVPRVPPLQPTKVLGDDAVCQGVDGGTPRRVRDESSSDLALVPVVDLPRSPAQEVRSKDIRFGGSHEDHHSLLVCDVLMEQAWNCAFNPGSCIGHNPPEVFQADDD
ncbi:hypothetical protein [Ktedonobacter robiniae]|uniref:hypothetical protein n=1 Tax=Ktedonobacter robiniae TaxID=2778365 RepID=UPI0019157B5D|nr:hypothetical protein [Ktedonobacter robiniae]